MLRKFFVLLVFVIVTSSCNQSLSPEDLYGKWNYIRVEHNGDPTDTIHTSDLIKQKPYIQFTKNNKLQIVWDGRVLSHGKFRIDGHNIRYTETLADSSTREFPFWVSELSDKKIVFNTIGADGSKVTAIK